MKRNEIETLLSEVSMKDEVFHEKDVIWQKINSKLQSCSSESRKNEEIRSRRLTITTYWKIAVSAAAVICLVVGLGSSVKLSSGHQELNYELPDGSKVELAANSSIRYNRIEWLFARNVTLDGDAVFSVVKNRGTFRVDAGLAKITVLGTIFSVKQNNDGIEVACTEGKVRVKTAAGEEILTKGRMLNFQEDKIVVKPIYPDYVEFNNANLMDVVECLEDVYAISIRNKDVCNYMNFSGYVATKNLNEALEVVFGSCGILYQLDKDILVLNGQWKE